MEASHQHGVDVQGIGKAAVTDGGPWVGKWTLRV